VSVIAIIRCISLLGAQPSYVLVALRPDDEAVGSFPIFVKKIQPYQASHLDLDSDANVDGDRRKVAINTAIKCKEAHHGWY
jgi:hypothetical protein